jgi:hypothetical protein
MCTPTKGLLLRCQVILIRIRVLKCRMAQRIRCHCWVVLGFSLHTMEVADNCTDALKQQSELYASHKNDSAGAESNGFKAISFRQLRGNGYDAIEFIQRVPNGKMDYERWVCAPHHLYVFASDWNPSEQQPPEIKRIVESFRLLTREKL